MLPGNEDDDDLFSLLCPEEPSLDKITYDGGKHPFFESLYEQEILPTLESILSREFVVMKKQSSSLLFRALSARVKTDRRRVERLQKVARILRLDQPKSWYSINHPQSWFSRIATAAEPSCTRPV